MAEILGLPASSGLVYEPSFALTLSDLPNELLFLIIHDLDNQSLLNLGVTTASLGNRDNR